MQGLGEGVLVPVWARLVRDLGELVDSEGADLDARDGCEHERSAGCFLDLDALTDHAASAAGHDVPSARDLLDERRHQGGLWRVGSGDEQERQVGCAFAKTRQRPLGGLLGGRGGFGSH